MLARTLDAGPCVELTFIIGHGGKPLTAGRFYCAFTEACRAAGLTGLSPHGVRKRPATRAEDAGASGHELEAIYGWKGGQMAALYSREVDRKRLAKQGMDKVVEMNRVQTSIPSPSVEKSLTPKKGE